MPIVHIDDNLLFDENNPNHEFIKEIIWVFFRENDDIKTSIRDLINAQKRDSEYVRQHTHYAVQASFWKKQKRHDDYLLRGDNLQKAELWLEKSKKFTEDILENEKNTENKICTISNIQSNEFAYSISSTSNNYEFFIHTYCFFCQLKIL